MHMEVSKMVETGPPVTKRKSAIWVYFSKISNTTARCELCLGEFSFKGGATSNLKKHLDKKHLNTKQPKSASSVKSYNTRNLSPEPIKLRTSSTTATDQPLNKYDLLTEEIIDNSQVIENHTNEIHSMRNANKKVEAEGDVFLAKVAGHHLSNASEIDIFAQLMAVKIKKLNRHHQVIAQNRISNFLFGLEMTELNCDTLHPISHSTLGSHTLREEEKESLLE